MNKKNDPKFPDSRLDELLGGIFRLSKSIIKSDFPEEFSFFDAIWTVTRDRILSTEIYTTRFFNKESEEFVLEGLGIADPSQKPDLTAPIIIAVISAIFWHIGTLDHAPKPEEIVTMIEYYSGKFGASGKVQDSLKSIIPGSELTGLIVREIKLRPSEEEEPSRRQYARMWDIETSDPEEAKLISMEKYEEIKLKKKRIPLLIIKTNGMRSANTYGRKLDLSPLQFDLLVYVLKNRGLGGSIINLLENVWDDKDTAQEFYRDIKKEAIEKSKKIEKLHFNQRMGYIRKGINSLNAILMKKFNIKLESKKSGQYRISGLLEYVLIEIV